MSDWETFRGCLYECATPFSIGWMIVAVLGRWLGWWREGAPMDAFDAIFLVVCIVLGYLLGRADKKR